MNLKTVYFFSGYLSLFIGLAAAFCIFKIQYIFLGIGLSLLGFISAGINIFLNTKHFYYLERYPKGYWGMLFSSLPILFMLFVIFKFKH